ncbi:MAG: hypothetical protein NW217_09215 [Hyphomicrobiaceae bacterium]|nr:hypothetical protein [Hyphomicrobiaceae bacterium]
MALGVERPSARRGPLAMLAARTARSLRITVLAMLAICGAALCQPPASAHWLDRLVRVAGDSGEDATGLSARLGRAGLHHLDDAVSALVRLPERPGVIALAAHATPEGHWQFVNKSGDVFTAASTDEMARIGQMLAPEAVATSQGSPKLALVLSEETVFRQASQLGDLPGDATLHLAHVDAALPMLARGAGTARRWLAEVRPGLLLDLASQPLYHEALAQLARPMGAANIRLLTFAADGARTIPAVAKRDATGRILPDLVAPEHLADALRSQPGKIIVVSGRTTGGLFDSLPLGMSRPVATGITPDELRKAAASAEVNLIVLNTSGPWQPGGRNWFGQTIEVDGLSSALEQATFGDFVTKLARQNTRHELKIAVSGDTRIRLDILPEPSDGGISDLAGSVGNWLGEAVSHVTGEIVTSALSADVNNGPRQSELDQRVVPGVPSQVHIVYLGALVAGVIGWAVARDWWARLWPPKEGQRWPGRLGRFLLFVVVFLPLAGVPALFWSLLLQLWSILMWPYRLLAWLLRRRAPQGS